MNYAHSARLGRPVANQAVQVRAQFIMRTYGHLLAAVLAFTGLEVFFFASGLVSGIASVFLGNPFITLGGFVIVGLLASNFSSPERSATSQYAALGAYVVFEALFFAPILMMAERVAPGAIQSAGLISTVGFVGLTMVAFTSRKDFSFLRPLISWGLILGLVAIVASLLFGFSLGVLFSAAMVFVAGASILYDTSQILRRYPDSAHVAASLHLFASVAMLFFYVLRIFMAFGDRD